MSRTVRRSPDGSGNARVQLLIELSPLLPNRVPNLSSPFCFRELSSAECSVCMFVCTVAVCVDDYIMFGVTEFYLYVDIVACIICVAMTPKLYQFGSHIPRTGIHMHLEPMRGTIHTHVW